MSQHSQEIMQLQNEVRALKQSVTTLCMQLQATTQLATALAATHPNKALALEVFSLFSLNDLHRAAGGEAKHQSALFMRMEQTQALIAEIGNSTDSQSFKTKEGRNGGTYACRELVIAYQVTESANGPLQYSTTPDADLDVLERIYSMYRAVLGAA